jgi:hypothetical protein
MSDRAWADRLIATLEDENPAAARLAQLACIAACIDAPLLRRLRHRFLQDADPGAEADLWFSPLMASQDSEGCVLHDAVALRLRERLAAEGKALIAPAVEVMQEAHAHLAASVRVEEELTALALMEGHDVNGQIERALQPCLRCLAGADEAAALEVARWAMHALRRMPERVRATEAAQIMVLGAALRLETPAIAATMPGAAVGAETLSWVLPERGGGKRVRLGVALFPNGVRFLEAEGAAPSIEVPDTQPAFVSVRWKSAGTDYRRLVAAAPNVFVDTGSGAEDIEIVTMAGDSYALSASRIAEATGNASGSSSAQAQSASLEHVPAAFLESCVLVEPLRSNAPPRIACPVDKGVWLTAGPTPPFLGIVGGAQGEQFEVLNAKKESAAIAVLLPMLPRSVQIAQLAPGGDRAGVYQGSVVGFDGSAPRGFRARIDGDRTVATLEERPSNGAVLRGAPVMAHGHLAGMLVEPLEASGLDWKFVNLLQIGVVVSSVTAGRRDAAREAKPRTGRRFERLLLCYSRPDYALAAAGARALAAHGVPTTTLEIGDPPGAELVHSILGVIGEDQAILAIATPAVSRRWIQDLTRAALGNQRPVLLAVTEPGATENLPRRISAYLFESDGSNGGQLAAWVVRELGGGEQAVSAAPPAAPADDHGASAACVRIGGWPEGGPTAFAVDSKFLVTYGNEFRWLEHRGEDTPPEDLTLEGDPAQYLEAVEKNHEIVIGAETVRKHFLILRPKGAAVPQRSIPLLPADDPAIAGLYSQGVPVVVLWHDRGFRPVSARATWSEAAQRIEVSIDDVPANRPLIDVLLAHHDWPDKIAGAPVLVSGKLLGMAVLRDHVQDQPVIALVEAWKLRAGLDAATRTRGAEQRRVFISYSKEDTALVQRIAAALRARGLLVHDEPGDFEWIRTSDLFMALATPRALASKYVQEEWNFAHSNEKRMLMAVLSPLTADQLPRGLQNLPLLELEEPRGNFEALVEEAARAAAGDAPLPRSFRETVTWAQQQLGAAGYRTVFADGEMGPLTRKALTDFQRSRKLPDDGRLTARTIAALDSVPLAQQRTPAQATRPRRTSSADADVADRAKRSPKRAKPKKKKPKRK